jgi:hypothetical protein
MVIRILLLPMAQPERLLRALGLDAVPEVTLVVPVVLILSVCLIVPVLKMVRPFHPVVTIGIWAIVLHARSGNP